MPEPSAEGQVLDLDAIEKLLETSGFSGLGGRVGALVHYIRQLIAALRQTQADPDVVRWVKRIAELERENEQLRQQLHSIGESFAAGEFVSRAEYEQVRRVADSWYNLHNDTTT